MAHHQLSAFASAIAELFARIPSSETADHHEQAYAQVYSEVGRLTQLLPSEQWPDALRVVHTSLGNQTSQIAHRSPPCLHTWSAMLANCSSVGVPGYDDWLCQVLSDCIAGCSNHRHLAIIWVELVYAHLTGPLSASKKILSAVAPMLNTFPQIELNDPMYKATLFAVLALLLPHLNKADARNVATLIPQLLSFFSPEAPPAHHRTGLMGDRVVEAISASAFALKSVDTQLFKSMQPVFLQWIHTMSSSSAWPTDVKLSALDYLVEYSSANSGVVRKSASTVNDFFSDCAVVATGALAELHVADSSKAAWEEPWLPFSAAMETLAKLVDCIGEKKSVGPLLQLVNQSMSAHASWSNFVFAMAALTQHVSLLLSAEDDDDQTKSVVNIILQFCSHTNASVRIAAFATLGALAADLDGYLQRNNAAAYFRVLTTCFTQASSSNLEADIRVTIAAASSLSSFCEYITIDEFLPYMTTTLQILDSLLQHRDMRVQEEAIGILSCVSRLVAHHLISSLPALVSRLLQCIQVASQLNALPHDRHRVQLRCLECASILLSQIAEVDASHKSNESIVACVSQVVQVMTHLTNEFLTANIPLKLHAYLWSAWARLVSTFPGACGNHATAALTACIQTLSNFVEHSDFSSTQTASTGASSAMSAQTREWVASGLSAPFATSRLRIRTQLLKNCELDSNVDEQESGHSLFLTLCRVANHNSGSSSGNVGLAQVLSAGSVLLEEFFLALWTSSPASWTLSITTVTSVLTRLLAAGKACRSEELAEFATSALKTMLLSVHKSNDLLSSIQPCFGSLTASLLQWCITAATDNQISLATFAFSSLHDSLKLLRRGRICHLSPSSPLQPLARSITGGEQLARTLLELFGHLSSSLAAPAPVDEDDDEDPEAQTASREELAAALAGVYIDVIGCDPEGFAAHAALHLNALIKLTSNGTLAISRAAVYIMASLPSVLAQPSIHLPTLLPPLIVASDHRDAMLRQAGVFGMGELAAFCDASALAPHVADLLQRLQHHIAAERAETYPIVADNATSAALKLAALHQLPSSRAQFLFSLLAALPLRTDVAENDAVCEVLLMLIHKQDSDLLGGMSVNVPRVAEVLLTHAQTLTDGVSVEPVVPSPNTKPVTASQSNSFSFSFQPESAEPIVPCTAACAAFERRVFAALMQLPSPELVRAALSFGSPIVVRAARRNGLI